MNKLFIKISVFFLMLVLGLSASIVWDFFTIPVQVTVADDLNFESIPIETTVCQIENYSNNLEGKLVSFKATTYAVGSELVLYPLDCTMTGSLFLEPSILANSGFKEKNSNLLAILQTRQDSSGAQDHKKMKEVDIKVIGIVKEYYDEDGYKLFSVIPKKIDIISDFRQFEPKDAA